MRGRLTATAIVAALVACLAIPISASAGTRLTANATGDQIVNPSGGDPNGSATFNLNVNRVKQRICFTIRFRGIQNATTASLHKGGRGEIARPIVTFFKSNSASSPQKGCVRDVRKRIIKRLKRKPSQHYVNIDSQQRPNGAVRGQLQR